MKIVKIILFRIKEYEPLISLSYNYFYLKIFW
jgi:hypothetical protein